MKIHLFLHADFEVSSVWDQWAVDRGYEVIRVPLFEGAALPRPAEVTRLAVLGGPMSAYDPIPWIQDEIRFLQEYTRLGRPVFGLCLGSQLLAQALGSPVRPHRGPEIGWYSLRTTDAARKVFPTLPPDFEVFHWHGDTYDLPQGCQLLGSSDLTPCQGFFASTGILALQFHPEITGPEIQGFLDHAPQPFLPGPGVQEPLQLLDPLRPKTANHEIFRDLLDRWVGMGTGPCPSCSDLHRPLFVENPADKRSLTAAAQEFPDSLLNLRPLHPHFQHYYKNTESRLLTCPECGRVYHYSQKPASSEDRLREVLLPLAPSEVRWEVERLAQDQKALAARYGSTYQEHLEKVVRASEEILQDQKLGEA